MSFINYLKLMASITSLNNEFEWTNKKYFTNE